MTTKFDHKAAETAAAIFAPLTARAASDHAVAVCDAAVAKVLHQQKRKPSLKQRQAFSALVADLLERDPGDNGGWLYRSMSQKNFSGHEVGYRPFTTVFDAMRGLFIDVVPGFRQYVSSELTGGVRQPYRDQATRFRATEWCRRWFADQGLTRDNWADHFIRSRPTPSPGTSPIELRAAKDGFSVARRRVRSMEVPKGDPHVTQLIERMNKLNAYLLDQDVQPYGPIFLRRIFGNGDQPGFAWDCGGRLNALGADSYQTAKKEDRAKITINGEPTAELDIRASHLTLLAGLGYVPAAVLEEDPYKVDGLPRELVKQWVTMTISNGSRHSRWPNAAKERFREKHGFDLTKDFPIRKTGDAILAKLPIIDADGQASVAGWGELQFRESEILLRAMEVLAFEYDVPALPVHDSLIVPEVRADVAAAVLKDSFKVEVGVEPVVTRER